MAPPASDGSPEGKQATRILSRDPAGADVATCMDGRVRPTDGRSSFPEVSMFARSFRLPYAQMLRAPRSRFRDVSLRGARGTFWLVSVDRDDAGGWLATVSDFYGCTGQYPCSNVLIRVSEVTRPRG